MIDPVAFAEARLDEEEAAAKATAPSGERLTWKASHEVSEEGTPVHWVVSSPNPAAVAHAFGLERATGGDVAEHIARYDPARALREVEAGRRILERHRDCGFGDVAGRYCGTRSWNGAAGCRDFRDLLVRWADHPDYDPLWSPA